MSVVEQDVEGGFGGPAPVGSLSLPVQPAEFAGAPAEADDLVAELARATATLAGLGERVEQVTASRQTLEHELAELRAELQRVGEQREREQARTRELVQQLATEHDRVAGLRGKLSELLRELDQ